MKEPVDSRRVYRVRSEMVSPPCARLPRLFVPQTMTPGAYGLLLRRVVADAYPPARFRGIDYENLTAHEKWTVAAARWRRVALKAAEAAGRSPRLDPRVVRMFSPAAGCFPAGYDRANPTRYVQSCGCPVCPHCHARSVGTLLGGVLKAAAARPEGSRFYYGVLFEDADREFSPAWFRRQRTAGGVAFRRPVRDGRWRHTVVAVSDSRKALAAAGLRGVVRLGRTDTLALRLARWFGYPRAWDASPPLRRLLGVCSALAALPPKTWRFQRFGAARATFKPGEGWCDFAANERRG